MGKVTTSEIRAIPPGGKRLFVVDTAKDCFTAVTLAYQLTSKEKERGIRYKCKKNVIKREVEIEAIKIEED